MTAYLAFVGAAMSRVQDNRLDVADVWNAVWPHQRLDGFGHVRARHQKFSVLFDDGKTQPTAHAVDHGLTTAADKFQRILHRLELRFVTGGNDACRQTVKSRNIIDAQVIVSAYLDDLPIIGSECRRLRQNAASREQ